MLRGTAVIALGDAAACYSSWPKPTVIVSDGAYGVAGFPGDPPTHEGLADWYRPHVEAWTARALPSTTLWFWGTEVGWATVHSLLDRHGWDYRACHIWDKGVAHIAGNANSRTLRKYPVTTEVCVQYVRDVRLPAKGFGEALPIKRWLRHEWERSGLPLSLANEACGVRNAATRKYLTQCHLWYFPPPEAFERFVDYVNRHGDPGGRPYFSCNGKRSTTAREWAALRAKFHCDVGVTNVWTEPAVRGTERIKEGNMRAIHANQKPLKLLDRIVRASSDPGDIVWEPFGGLGSTAIASIRAGRICCSAEIDPGFYAIARKRIEDEMAKTLAA